MRTQRGNILFLILLAVVLFAALAYAVTSAMRGGTQEGMSKEAANAAASDIASWLASVDQGVQRMMLVNNILVEQIDVYDTNNFNYGGTIRANKNENCTTDACQIFNPNGGGVISRSFAKYGGTMGDGYMSHYVAAGSKEYLVKSIQDLGTPLNDVVIQVSGIKLEICKAYNRLQNLPDCPSASQTGTFTGFYGAPGVATTNLDSSSAYVITGQLIKGRHSFCRCNPSSNIGAIDHAIIIR